MASVVSLAARLRRLEKRILPASAKPEVWHIDTDGTAECPATGEMLGPGELDNRPVPPDTRRLIVQWVAVDPPRRDV